MQYSVHTCLVKQLLRAALFAFIERFVTVYHIDHYCLHIGLPVSIFSWLLIHANAVLCVGIGVDQ